MSWFLLAHSPPHLSAAGLTYIQRRQLNLCLQSAVSPSFWVSGTCREKRSPFICFFCAQKPRVSRGQFQIIQLSWGKNQFVRNEGFCKCKNWVWNEIWSRNFILVVKIFFLSVFLNIYSQKWSSFWIWV